MNGYQTGFKYSRVDPLTGGEYTLVMRTFVSKGF